MSMIGSNTGRAFQAGYFLVDDEECTRVTKTISASHAQVITRADGTKIVPAGAIIPANSSSAVGILYEDVDVTEGAHAGSVVTAGQVIEAKLPASAVSDAKTAMTGIKFVTAPSKAKRPTSFDGSGLAEITVASTAGSGSGKTDVAVSGYSLKAGESYVYKTHATAAPTCYYGEILPTSGGSAWTAATFPLDELSATSGHKIAVAAVDATGAAVAYGYDDITVGA